MSLQRFWVVVEDWFFVTVLGFVGTALFSYPIRMYFHKEFFERLSIHGNLLFVAILWIFVAVFIARPISEQWEEDENED